eukprot:gene3537-4459_t
MEAKVVDGRLLDSATATSSKSGAEVIKSVLRHLRVRAASVPEIAVHVVLPFLQSLSSNQPDDVASGSGTLNAADKAKLVACVHFLAGSTEHFEACDELCHKLGMPACFSERLALRRLVPLPCVALLSGASATVCASATERGTSSPATVLFSTNFIAQLSDAYRAPDAAATSSGSSAPPHINAARIPQHSSSSSTAGNPVAASAASSSTGRMTEALQALGVDALQWRDMVARVAADHGHAVFTLDDDLLPPRNVDGAATRRLYKFLAGPLGVSFVMRVYPTEVVHSPETYPLQEDAPLPEGLAAQLSSASASADVVQVKDFDSPMLPFILEAYRRQGENRQVDSAGAMPLTVMLMAAALALDVPPGCKEATAKWPMCSPSSQPGINHSDTTTAWPATAADGSPSGTMTQETKAAPSAVMRRLRHEVWIPTMKKGICGQATRLFEHSEEAYTKLFNGDGSHFVQHTGSSPQKHQSGTAGGESSSGLLVCGLLTDLGIGPAGWRDAVDVLRDLQGSGVARLSEARVTDMLTFLHSQWKLDSTNNTPDIRRIMEEETLIFVPQEHYKWTKGAENRDGPGIWVNSQQCRIRNVRSLRKGHNKCSPPSGLAPDYYGLGPDCYEMEPHYARVLEQPLKDFGVPETPSMQDLFRHVAGMVQRKSPQDQIVIKAGHVFKILMDDKRSANSMWLRDDGDIQLFREYLEKFGVLLTQCGRWVPWNKRPEDSVAHHAQTLALPPAFPRRGCKGGAPAAGRDSAEQMIVSSDLLDRSGMPFFNFLHNDLGMPIAAVGSSAPTTSTIVMTEVCTCRPVADTTPERDALACATSYFQVWLHHSFGDLYRHVDANAADHLKKMTIHVCRDLTVGGRPSDCHYDPSTHTLHLRRLRDDGNKLNAPRCATVLVRDVLLCPQRGEPAAAHQAARAQSSGAKVLAEVLNDVSWVSAASWQHMTAVDSSGPVESSSPCSEEDMLCCQRAGVNAAAKEPLPPITHKGVSRRSQDVLGAMIPAKGSALSMSVLVLAGLRRQDSCTLQNPEVLLTSVLSWTGSWTAQNSYTPQNPEAGLALVASTVALVRTWDWRSMTLMSAGAAVAQTSHTY